jgi:hypothetical protein
MCLKLWDVNMESKPIRTICKSLLPLFKVSFDIASVSFVSLCFFHGRCNELFSSFFVVFSL